MDIIDQYFELQHQIHDSFNYKEDWCIIPLEDYRNMYWHLTGEGYGNSVIFHETSSLSERYGAGDYYETPIYTQRFLPKWVYRNEKYTMVSIDTQTDGNKCLAIFDNEKEVKDEDFYR